MPEAGIGFEVWNQQSIWSQTADRMKRTIGRARLGMLAATVLGAILATAASALAASASGPSRALAVAAAVAVGVAPLFRSRCTGTALQHWTRARSVSEALKSEVYQWLARSGEYRGEDRDVRLREIGDFVARLGSDLLRHTVPVRAKQRGLPDVDDAASYFRVRVAGQIEGYYQPRAVELRRTLRRLAMTQIGLTVSGIVLSATVATYPELGLGGWVAVAMTIGAAVSAYSAAGRLEYQLVEYLRTADELRRILRNSAEATTAAGTDALIRDSERVISIQNEGWMAKLAADPVPPGGSPA